MKRRTFLSVMAGGLFAGPLAVEAQQAGRMPGIGYLGASSPALEPETLEAFQQGLHDLGYIEGQNIGLTVPPALLARADEVIK